MTNAQSQFDVFLCHNSDDKPRVRQIQDQLRLEGIKTWIDEKDIIGFDDWITKIKENIAQVNAVAVFLGSSGFGKWQEYEIMQIYEEIDRRQKNELYPLRVGFVILDSCKQTFQEIRHQYQNTPSGWLFGRQTVDLRTLAEPIKELIIAITGQQRNSNVDADSILSSCGVNYARLRNFLREGLWEEADKETFAVVSKVVASMKEGSVVTDESIKNFPYTDLHTIDQLWVKNSKGRFGFSVQKRIWERVEKDYGNFIISVGWGKKTFGMLTYENPTFDINALQGHLPALVHWWKVTDFKNPNPISRQTGILYYFWFTLYAFSLLLWTLTIWGVREKRYLVLKSLLSRPDL